MSVLHDIVTAHADRQEFRSYQDLAEGKLIRSRSRETNCVGRIKSDTRGGRGGRQRENLGCRINSIRNPAALRVWTRRSFWFRVVSPLKAKKFLVSRGIPFEERDIRTNPDYLRILTEELDSRTTPTLVLADKVIVGFDQAEYELLASSVGTKRKRRLSEAEPNLSNSGRAPLLKSG